MLLSMFSVARFIRSMIASSSSARALIEICAKLLEGYYVPIAEYKNLETSMETRIAQQASSIEQLDSKFTNYQRNRVPKWKYEKLEKRYEEELKNNREFEVRFEKERNIRRFS